MSGLRFRLLVLLAVFNALDVRADVTSIGDWACHDWLARHDPHGHADPPQMWLSGYMTGLATALNLDVLAYTNAEALFKDMDDYCRANPATQLSAGGLALFERIRRRLPTSPPHAL